MRNPSHIGACCPETLVMICRVLDESFRAIVTAGLLIDGGDWRDEIRIRLAEVIIREYERGERDPVALHHKAVAIVGPNYIGGLEAYLDLPYDISA